MPFDDAHVARVVRDYLKPFETQDVAAFTDAASIDGGSVGGFGWRTSSWRNDSAVTPDKAMAIAASLFSGMDYYRGTLGELNTWSEDDVGLAWGTWTEEFRRNGFPPQVARVRFTFTLKKHPDGWKLLMYHRDVQPFDKDGRCPLALTTVEQKRGRPGADEPGGPDRIHKERNNAC